MTGILDIKTDDEFRTREDGLKEAQYGDTFYLCTIIFESGESKHFFCFDHLVIGR